MIDIKKKLIFLFITLFLTTGTVSTVSSAKPTRATEKKLFILKTHYPDNIQYNIHFIYYHDFSWRTTWQHINIQGCHQFKSSRKISVLRCKEQVNLVRSGKLINALLHRQNKTGHVNLNVSRHAYIVAVTEYYKKNKSEHTDNTISVSGTFMHHVMDTKEYTFRTSQGTTEKITATPQHRFYVLNKQQFLPIKNISSTDLLITSSGKTAHIIYLECHRKKIYKINKPTTVYNIEINNKHTYFVGKNNILVHNWCSKIIRQMIIGRPTFSKKSALTVQKFSHKLTTNYKMERVIVSSKYVHTTQEGTVLKANIMTGFMEHKILILDAYKDTELNFFASDIARLQLQLATEAYPFPFDIHRQTKIIIPSIIHQQTLQKLEEQIPRTEKFLEVFLHTPCGKYLRYFTQGLNWQIISADYTNYSNGPAKSLTLYVRH